MTTPAQQLLETLPDTARWVETRGALLARVALLFGADQGWIVRIDEQRLLSVVGEPRSDQLSAAIEGVEGEWTLICSVEAGERWAGLLPGWSLERATLHELGGMPGPQLVPKVEARVARVTRSSPELLEHLPRRLRREIGVVVGRRPLFAAWVGGRAVSFCYAAFETETLWDVSVDTLAEFRRMGLAGACVVATIRHLAASGKRPVWGAVAGNEASLGLAARLGFVAVDEIGVLEGQLGNQRATDSIDSSSN